MEFSHGLCRLLVYFVTVKTLSGKLELREELPALISQIARPRTGAAGFR
jgi:hypothetical protein